MEAAPVQGRCARHKGKIALGVATTAAVAAVACYFLWKETPLLLGCGLDPRTLAHWMDHSCASRQDECGDAYPQKLQCCSTGLQCRPRQPPAADLCAQTPIRAVNQSYEAPCAEWDNVRVAFKRSGEGPLPAEVRVTAAHPRYVDATDLNRQDARFCDCSSSGPPVQADPPRATEAQEARRLGRNGGRKLGVECSYSNKKFYDDGNVSLVAWCDPLWEYDLMEIRDRNGPLKPPLHASNIEVYAKIPDTGKELSYGGVFVLYSNGYARLLPMVPPKMSPFASIPFGTSAVLGPSRDAGFPAGQIDALELRSVFAETVELGLTYAFGNAGPVQLEYTPSRLSSTATLRGLTWEDPSLAYVRLSSMYVQPGVSDSDVLVDGSGAARRLAMQRPVPGAEPGAWTELEGPSWSLEKECVSVHNTLAPDTLLELAKCPDAGGRAEV